MIFSLAIITYYYALLAINYSLQYYSSFLNHPSATQEPSLTTILWLTNTGLALRIVSMMNYYILAINCHIIPYSTINSSQPTWVHDHPWSPWFTASPSPSPIHRQVICCIGGFRQVFGASMELSLKLSVDRALQQAMAKAEAVLQETSPSVPPRSSHCFGEAWHDLRSSWRTGSSS